MMVMLGDEVTISKGETWITGRVAGVVLNDKRELDRVYLHEIGVPFYMSEGWRFMEDNEEWDGEEE